jgi:hypothetical protein
LGFPKWFGVPVTSVRVSAHGHSYIFPAGTTVRIGLDAAILIVVPGGTAVASDYGGLSQATVTKSSGCLSYELVAAQLGQAVLTAGRYQLQLLGSPELTPLGPAASLTVGSPAAGTPSP